MGGPEREQQINFDRASTFGEIIDVISKAPAGSLKDSQGNNIDVTVIIAVKTIFEHKGLVGSDLINSITRNKGLREAVVRALAPSFDMEKNLTSVLDVLKKAQDQNNELKGIKGADGRQLSFMTDNSGNPVDLNSYVLVLGQIIDFLTKNPQTKLPNEDQYMGHFTSKYGLRGAIQRGIATVTGDTGRFSY